MPSLMRRAHVTMHVDAQDVDAPAPRGARGPVRPSSTSFSSAANASPCAFQHCACVVRGAGRAQRLGRVERERAHERVGVRRLREAHPSRDGARPGLAERRVAVTDELLRVAEARPHRAARPPLGALVPVARRVGHDGGHDERPEARAEAVLVDSDADDGFHGAGPHFPYRTAATRAGAVSELDDRGTGRHADSSAGSPGRR